jgi:hypothetical protein
MKAIEMPLTTQQSRSDEINTKNVLLENKAGVNTQDIMIAWSEDRTAGTRETDYKLLKPGENVFFSAERKRTITRIWAYAVSGTPILSITGSDSSINKPSQVVARPAWYDRNPNSQAWSISYNQGPHSESTDVQYTVPSGKKAMVEILQALVIRTTAATTPGSPTAAWKLTPNGASIKMIINCGLDTSENSPKDKLSLSIGSTMMMFPGDKIQSSTLDGGTGGTCTYILNMKITEFDA